jgi:hypothetical protein
MSKIRWSVFVVFSLMTPAAWAADASFVGAWKLDQAKSRLTDQMKVESVEGGKFTVDFGGATESVTADGTDQPGYGGTTLAVSIEAPDALRVVRKKDGHRLLTADWTLSKDGKTLSDDFTSFAPDGTASELKYVYDRTTPTSGFAGTWESANVKVNFDLTITIQPYEGGGLSIVSPLSDKPKDLSFDGKYYPNKSSNAPKGAMYSAKRVDEHTLEITDKLDGKTVDTQQYALSSDLRTLTLTVHRTGMRMPNILVFDRQ